MSNYTKTTDFAVKDGLAPGNPAKVIKGTEHDVEYNNIATAVNSKADTAGPSLSGVPTTPLAATGTNTTQIASTSFVQQEAVFMFGSRGLLGIPNAGSPLTKYDLSADFVQLKNSTNNTVVRSTVTTITNDLGLAGITANGRDQVAAFGASNWIHIYFIWNGTTLATVSSLTAPPTGPALPTGYTHWCYATALRWNGSSNIVAALTRGAGLYYDVDIILISSGTSTSFSTVSLATAVPPNAVHIGIFNLLGPQDATAKQFTATIRPTGGTIGLVVCNTFTQVASQFITAESYATIIGGTSQQIDYKISAVPSVSGGFSLSVMSFTIPNGAL